MPKRRNIVVTRNADYQAKDCEMASSLDAALALVADEKEICIIGGAQLFQEALPIADRLYLTFIDLTVDGDTFFPSWNSAQWQEISRESLLPAEGNVCALEFVVLDRAF